MKQLKKSIKLSALIGLVISGLLSCAPLRPKQEVFNYKFQLGMDSSFVGHEVKNGSGNLRILVVNNKFQSLDFMQIQLKSASVDTAYLTDSSGLFQLVELGENFMLTIRQFGFCPVEKYSGELDSNHDVLLTVYMGNDLRDSRGHIRSKRKLLKPEIESIIQSLQNKESHPLLKSGVCRIQWEI